MKIFLLSTYIEINKTVAINGITIFIFGVNARVVKGAIKAEEAITGLERNPFSQKKLKISNSSF